MLLCGSRTPRRQRWRYHRAVVAHHRQLPVQPVATRPRLVAETQIHLPVVQPTHKLAYCLRRRWDIAAKFRGWRPGAATATVMASRCCSKATVFVDFHMTSSFSRCAHALGVVISTAQGNPRSSRLGEVLQKSVNTLRSRAWSTCAPEHSPSRRRQVVVINNCVRLGGQSGRGHRRPAAGVRRPLLQSPSPPESAAPRRSS